MRLEAQGVELSYDQKVVAPDLSLAIPDGKISVLIGPNGCGKSTALRSLSRLLKPQQGVVILDGQAINRLSTKEVARRLAILPQLLVAPDSISVEDLVWYGRHPHRGALTSPSKKDREVVEWALAATNLLEMRTEFVDALSGGQRQRAWIALCLAQGTDLLLLDEPTTFLDIAYQFEVLDLLAELNRDRGTTVTMVLHDFNSAAEYADHIFALRDGKLVTEGTPDEVLTPDVLSLVFGIEAQVVPHPVSGRPLCIPLRGGRQQQSRAAGDQRPTEARVPDQRQTSL